MDAPDAATTLSLVSAAQRQVLDNECRLVPLAAHWSDLHHPDSQAPAEKTLPGAEQGRRLGGDGTPEVLEFASAEFGAQMQTSSGSARALMADASDLRHRLPELWQLIVTGGIPAWKARKVAQATRHLSRSAAMQVDAAVARAITGLPSARFETLLAAKIIEADPRATEEQAKIWEAERFVRVGRTSQHGLKLLIAKANAGERALRPGHRPARRFHLSEEALASYQCGTTRFGGGVGRFEGVGPVTLGQVRRFLAGTGCDIRVQPVIDPRNSTPVDSYEIPRRIREATFLRMPASRFPYATAVGRLELDHTRAYLPLARGGPPGQTAVHGLGPMVRFEYRVKTHGRWRVRQPEPGVWIWRSPHGAHYLVTNAGNPQPRKRTLRQPTLARRSTYSVIVRRLNHRQDGLGHEAGMRRSVRSC